MLKCENNDYAQFWGKLIGIVEDVDGEGPIIRVHAQLDVTKPSKRGIGPFINEVGCKIMLLLQYEWLPNFGN